MHKREEPSYGCEAQNASANFKHEPSVSRQVSFPRRAHLKCEMSVRAREVLAECQFALEDFSAAGNTPFQRTRWVAVTTLLRAVGHVLDKVDGPAGNPALRQSIEAHWKALTASKPEPRIFWEFIETERNGVVKEFDVKASVITSITPGPATLTLGPDSGGPSMGTTTVGFVMVEGTVQGL
jgi:hypothetical protein